MKQKVTFRVEDKELIREGPWPFSMKGALADSIAKWRYLEKYPGYNYVDTCALCHVYHKSLGICTGCPVRARTGEDVCRDTPYQSLPTKAQAREMRNFLLSIWVEKYGPEKMP